MVNTNILILPESSFYSNFWQHILHAIPPIPEIETPSIDEKRDRCIHEGKIDDISDGCEIHILDGEDEASLRDRCHHPCE